MVSRSDPGRALAPAPAVLGPSALGVDPSEGLPLGTVVELDPGTRQPTPDTLFGGSPGRLLRLSDLGRRALDELRAGRVTSAPGSRLGRRLTDVGMAHPRPEHVATPPSITVVVPVKDRTDELDRCLGALGTGVEVVVVDDGSTDAGALAAIGAAHGAHVLRRAETGGPGAARNTALGVVRTELVAFVDSDCEVPAGWLGDLAGHLADPLVAAVAPRLLGVCRDGSGGARAAPRCPLDLGAAPGLVRPGTPLAYVPTAALLVRRAALGGGFDEALRYGEDVDLVWRLVAAGWRVRYDPGVQAHHREPQGEVGRALRRFRYGTSAGPLARRHPGNLVHLVLSPGPTATVAALLARRVGLAALAFAAQSTSVALRLRALGIPPREAVVPSAGAVGQTWLALGRYCQRFAPPALVAVALRPGRSSAKRRFGRLAAASLLIGPSLVEWRRTHAGGAVGYCLEDLLEQAAYGAGVYAGCLRERVFEPLVPSVPAPWWPQRDPPSPTAPSPGSGPSGRCEPGQSVGTIGP